jgi:DNA transposition AAA+ family ATPase
MTATELNVNGNGTIAPLKNVSLFSSLMHRVVNRAAHLPGMATFHGYSGYGKTFAATFAANKFGARYIEMGESWTKKKLCASILTELGVQSQARTISDQMDQIIEALAIDGVPLIIDEADYLGTKGLINLIREIHDKSGAPILLIGEEGLPGALSRWERVHNRMLDWVPAQPSSLDDARHLARLYCPKITVKDDLLTQITEAASGRARRICVSLERVREVAVTQGLDSVGSKEWGDRQLFRGQPPARRK